MVERLLVVGPAGSLEAVAEDIDMLGGHAGDRFAVVCHPHPLFGGTMDNKVVTTVAGALHQAGIPTIRFNFRGVGRSAGAFDAGTGESADARAICAWGAARWPGRRLVLTGFSFGAYVALRVSQGLEMSQLVTIAPPVKMFDFAGLSPPACPWLVVQGDADDVVDPQSVIDWAGGLLPQPHLTIMPGVGHFFHGRLVELRDAVYGAVTGAIRGG